MRNVTQLIARKRCAGQGKKRGARQAPTFGPRATSPDAEGDPGPRAHRRAPTSPQRHADEGRHPRQANASALGLSWFPAFAGMTARWAPTWPSWPDLIRPPRRAAAVLGPRVNPRIKSRDGDGAAEHWAPTLDRARPRAPVSAGEDARGPEGAHVPAASCRRRSASTAGKRLRPAACRQIPVLGLSWFPAFAGMTARVARKLTGAIWTGPRRGGGSARR